MKLLLDEHLSLVIANELNHLGYDVVCVAQLPGLRGLDDPGGLRYAAAQGRILVSANRSTMPTAAETLRAEGDTHTGVVLIARERFTLSKRNLGPLIAALAHLIDTHDPDQLDNRVTWLSPISPT